MGGDGAGWRQDGPALHAPSDRAALAVLTTSTAERCRTEDWQGVGQRDHAGRAGVSLVAVCIVAVLHASIMTVWLLNVDVSSLSHAAAVGKLLGSSFMGGTRLPRRALQARA